MNTVLVLPGDGIGPEIIAEADKVLRALISRHGLQLRLRYAEVGGAAIARHGAALPPATLEAAQAADAVLLGAVGGPQWESLDIARRPEKALLGLRAGLGLFANLRPAVLYPELAQASTLRADVVAGLDLLIVRELTGGIYFGEPRGIRRREDGEREGFNTLVYRESEIERIARCAFDAARERTGCVCSVDKANVLECTQLWREVVTRVKDEYPDVTLSHMYVDNAAMQLVMAPGQFDIIVTTNLFGDILSDIAAAATGSIGMLPSASLDARGKGMYEPIHGAAPDIAGTNTANPLATVLSVAMMLRYSLGQARLADAIHGAVASVLRQGLRTADIVSGNAAPVSTSEMGSAVVDALLA